MENKIVSCILTLQTQACEVKWNFQNWNKRPNKQNVYLA